jgi:hypothetical protein
MLAPQAKISVGLTKRISMSEAALVAFSARKKVRVQVAPPSVVQWTRAPGSDDGLVASLKPSPTCCVIIAAHWDTDDC